MIQFKNEFYAIDINKFFDIFSGNFLDENDVNTVITATYGEDDTNTSNNNLALISKEVVESKRNGIDTLYGLRFDTLKYLVETLFNVQYDEQNRCIKEIKTYEDLTFPQQIAFNSLVKAGILIKVNNDL